MGKYTGVGCPVCGTEFKEKDDIVVCPVCGAPHHRDCYKKLDKCAYEQNHASGSEWKRPESKAYDNNAENRCPRCNTKNPVNGVICQVCGELLNKKAETQGQQGAASMPGGVPFGGRFYGDPPFYAYTTPYGGINPEDELDGVSAKDLAIFVGDNSHIFLPKFKDIAFKKTSVTWNWPAFFFGFFYFLYRKCYGVALISAIILIGLSIPSAIATAETIRDMTAQITAGAAITTTDFSSPTVNTVSYICSLLSFTARGFFAMMFNTIYFKQCVKKVKKIKANKMVPEIEVSELSKSGGVNRRIIFFMMILYFLLSFAYTIMLLSTPF